MSRINNTSNATPLQKFCKVCQDAGKSESEFRSHFTRETRDTTSKVTCPTLLSLECRYCYKNGHTVKYCPSLKEKEKQQKSYDNLEVYNTKKSEKKIISKNTDRNIFNCLDSFNDEDKPVIKIKEQFPVLCTPVKQQIQVKNSYVDALNKQVDSTPVFVVAQKPVPTTPIPEKQIIPNAPTKKALVSAPKPAPWATNIIKPTKLSWAAMDSDSESEYEEEEEDDTFIVSSNSTYMYDSTW